MAEFRLAKKTDAEGIAALSGQLGYPVELEGLRSRLTGHIKSNTSAVWVAEDSSGKLISWLHAQILERLESEWFVEIGGLVVESQSRRQGIGRQMITAVRQWAADQGVQKIRVRVNHHRDEAIMFYRHLGFKLEKKQVVLDLPLN